MSEGTKKLSTQVIIQTNQMQDIYRMFSCHRHCIPFHIRYRIMNITTATSSQITYTQSDQSSTSHCPRVSSPPLTSVQTPLLDAPSNQPAQADKLMRSQLCKLITTPRGSSSPTHTHNTATQLTLYHVRLDQLCVLQPGLQLCVCRHSPGLQNL